MNSNTKPAGRHVIVTDNDHVLERGLTLSQAEQRLAYYLGHEEDAFIGDESDWPEKRAMNKITIARNGMKVDCYGQWQEDSNCLLVGDWQDGDEMEEIWAGDGWPDDQEWPSTWTQVVEHLTAWAKRKGHTLYELTAC